MGYLVDGSLPAALVAAPVAAPVVGLQVVALARHLGAVVSQRRAVHQESVLGVQASQHVVGLLAGAPGGHHQRQEVHLAVPGRRHRSLVAPAIAHYLDARRRVVVERCKNGSVKTGVRNSTRTPLNNRI